MAFDQKRKFLGGFDFEWCIGGGVWCWASACRLCGAAGGSGGNWLRLILVSKRGGQFGGLGFILGFINLIL